MQRIRISTHAFVALGLVGALAADASVAYAQETEQRDPSADTPTTPKAPEASAPTQTRPGPLDVVVMFQPKSAEMQAGSHARLDEVSEWLKQDPMRRASIEAHPDEAARADFSASLLDERSDTVRRYLLDKGSAESQLSSVAPGESRSEAVGDNQRTVFIMSAEGQPAPTAEAEPPPPVQPITAPQRSDRDDHLLTRFGMAVTLGGGVVDFMDDEARAIGDMGGAWEARLTVGTRMPLAIEAAYVGSAQNIDALGLDTSAVLLGTTVETDLRVNFTTGMLQPYIFGGIGYSRYDVTNEDFNTSSVNDEEEMGTIPVGAGLGYQMGGLILDLRGTVRPAFEDDLVAEPATEDDPLDDSDTATDLDTWSVAARVGWEF